MKFVPNVGRVIRRAWSVRFLALAGGLSALEFILQSMGESFLSPRAYTLLTGLTIGAAFVARIVAQRDVSGDDE
ncbi:hypothetical protein NS226_06655 [Aureimonas ureilytica]|uniref:Uncharacterized protein n=1 Tax=Aureimonas ureilytica TaxID=401562 RepID=A0A175RCW6_9HYPH|nr:hypothetical protein [Aureimonas ureilytica]KTQ96795.1 hypothetical protein NS226_06655 [Aureimonas ureilytica]